jgi:hypothetical protein
VVRAMAPLARRTLTARVAAGASTILLMAVRQRVRANIGRQEPSVTSCDLLRLRREHRERRLR